MVDAVRFATDDFFNTDLGYDEIEFAPSNSIVEMPSDETTEVFAMALVVTSIR